NSGVFTGPLGENSRRMALAQPTLHTAAPKRSGRSVIARLIRIPPALVPVPPSFAGLVKTFFTSYYAQAMQSVQRLGLVVLNPALYQATPFSLPPRTWANASTIPRLAMDQRTLKYGV